MYGTIKCRAAAQCRCRSRLHVGGQLASRRARNVLNPSFSALLKSTALEFSLFSFSHLIASVYFLHVGRAWQTKREIKEAFAGPHFLNTRSLIPLAKLSIADGPVIKVGYGLQLQPLYSS